MPRIHTRLSRTRGAVQPPAATGVTRPRIPPSASTGGSIFPEPPRSGPATFPLRSPNLGQRGCSARCGRRRVGGAARQARGRWRPTDRPPTTGRRPRRVRRPTDSIRDASGDRPSRFRRPAGDQARVRWERAGRSHQRRRTPLMSPSHVVREHAHHLSRRNAPCRAGAPPPRRPRPAAARRLAARARPEPLRRGPAGGRVRALPPPRRLRPVRPRPRAVPDRTGRRGRGGGAPRARDGPSPGRRTVLLAVLLTTTARLADDPEGPVGLVWREPTSAARGPWPPPPGGSRTATPTDVGGGDPDAPPEHPTPARPGRRADRAAGEEVTVVRRRRGHRSRASSEQAVCS
jgi:hypothetical protein